MASNLNKAFMRAYAKDRSAPTDEAPGASAALPPASNVASPAAPIPSAPVAVAPRVPTAQPSMEPTVFAGRYAPPQAPVARTAAVQPTPVPATTPATTPVVTAPVVTAQAAQPMPTAPTAHSRPVRSMGAPAPVVPVAPVATSQRMAAPGVQPVSSQQRVAQPRVVTAAPRQPAPVHSVPSQPMRVEQAPASEPGEASRVWQRIDAAHGSPATHPTEMQPRPTVAVGATRTAAPKRMQAAAPAPVAPAPAAPATGSKVRVDAPTPPNTRPLPLVGDEALAPSEPQQSESRRRTVADFLYSAGQYNPGRILASAEYVDSDVSATAATAMPAASLRTSEMVRPADRGFEDVQAHDQAMSSLQTSSPAVVPSHSYSPPVVEEAVPRRMGQILRVDVPRNHSSSSTTSMPTQSSAKAERVASMDHEQQHVTETAAMPIARQSTAAAAQPMPPVSQPAPAPTVDAPVAKYVLEQRRMDRAHKLNEVEEKLRSDTHKIFNPVWEVDSLQWPAVVDKLMQQRAQSMSHVAEHLKTACQDGLSVLGVTSAHHSEGRTTVACCLARLAAAHGLNVALIDIDLDHPTLCVQTNMEVEHDWRDCLTEDISLEEVAVHSIDDQLTMLPLKPRGDRPGLLASDSRIADILNDLSECFELVIVDCSKTGSSGNIITGLAHTKIFDAAIVVVDRRDGQADRVEDAVRMIQQTGIESIGIVDNFSM